MKLSIIIIEYHCMNQVKECVASIHQYLNEVEKECFIISNSEYSESELNAYKHDIPDSIIIDAHGNLGYTGGINIGIKHVSGDYIYVLNPDCLLTDSNVAIMMQAMEEDPKWAIAGPKVVDEECVVQPSCRRFPKLWTFLLVRSFLSNLPGANIERSRYLMEDFDRKETKEVDWVSGGATLVKSSSISQIGTMDERYFLYMEDVDWCRSCWLNDMKVKYNPISTIVHAGQHQSISGGFVSKLLSKHVRLHLTSMFKYFLKYDFTVNK